MQKISAPYITTVNSTIFFILLFLLIIAFSCNNQEKPAIDFHEKYYRRSICEISVKKLAKSDKPIKFNYTIYYHHAEQFINHGFIVNNFSDQKLKLRPILNTRFDSVFFNKFVDNQVLTSSPIGSNEKKSLHHLRSRLDTLKLCQNGQKIFAFLIHNESGDTTNFEVSFQLKQLKTTATFWKILFYIFQILAIAIILTSFYFLVKDLIKGEKPSRLWFIYKFQEFKKEVAELRDIKLLQKEEIDSIKKDRDTITLDLIKLESELALEKAKAEELSSNVAQKNKEIDQLFGELGSSMAQIKEYMDLNDELDKKIKQNQSSLTELKDLWSIVLTHEKLKNINAFEELIFSLRESEFFKKVEESDKWLELISTNKVGETLELMSKNKYFANNEILIVIKYEYSKIKDSKLKGTFDNGFEDNKVIARLLSLIADYKKEVISTATTGEK